MAVLVKQPGLVGDRNQRAGRVEHVDEEEGYHHRDQGNFQCL